MRFLGFLALVVGLVLALAVWRGWFTVTVDRAKVREDTDKAIQKVRDTEERILEGASKDKDS